MTSQPQPSATINPDEAAKFVSVIAGNEPGLFVLIPEPATPDVKAFTRFGPWEAMRPLLEKDNANGFGVHLAINKTTGARRRTEDVIEVRALFVDSDGAALPAEWDLDPSLVCTRSDPRRWHAYWLLKSGENFKKWSNAQKLLAAHYGTDPAICDLPRTMRVPGFIHAKDPSKPDRYCVSERRDGDFTIAEVLAAHGINPETKPKRKPAPRTVAEAGGRNNLLTSMGGSMRRAGFDQEAIAAALKVRNETEGIGADSAMIEAISKSVGSYAVPMAFEAGTLNANVRQGMLNYDLRVNAVERLCLISSGESAEDWSPDQLADQIWDDLRNCGKKIPHEDITRVMNIEIRRDAKRARADICERVLGHQESPAALEELRRYVKVITGSVDKAVVAGLLQFIWCVKRSLAGKRREHDIMPILYGRTQGRGKSTAVERLVSPVEELADRINADTLTDERKRKDLKRFYIGIWDEMEGADKKDVEAIKGTITSYKSSFRPMRSNDNVEIIRRMNFIGSSNKPVASIVRDESGNRRFLEIPTRDGWLFDEINDLNYPLLWQAVSENSQAPLKASLGEVQLHQAEGRYQDSVALWLESEDWSTLRDGLTADDIKQRYVVWSERQGDSPMRSDMFLNRLLQEGFARVRPRSETGKRQRLYLPPESLAGPAVQGGPGVVQGWSRGENGGVDQCKSSIIATLHTLVHPVQGETGGSGKNDFSRNVKDPGPGGPPWTSPPGLDLNLWVYDVEVFPNRFMFQAFNGTVWAEFDETPRSLGALATWLQDKKKVLAGFNNHSYDDVLAGMLAMSPKDRTIDSIYARSTRLIEDESEAGREANFQDKYAKRPWAYSIDVFQLLNGKGSLKEWECRMGFPTLAESPAAFNQPLPDDQLEPVRQYCRNDVLATATMLHDKWHLVTLRETLAKQFDLGPRAYCLSEQGLAQATFLGLHRKRTGQTSNVVRTAAASAPENQGDTLPLAELISDKVIFASDSYRDLLTRLKADRLAKKDSWALEGLTEPIELGGRKVSLMVGGLHSVDEPGIISATPGTDIIDLDVTSYYPSLMLVLGITPSQLGDDFLDDFQTLRDQRVAAKAAGDLQTSEALKIVLNATFGKLNDTWSPLRSVRNAFRVTMNGQLYLLMLMEQLQLAGFTILSANTDGITISATKQLVAQQLADILAIWEKATGLKLESTRYAKICRRDVNTYVALTTDGKLKTKGDLNPDAGKSDGRVIVKAANALLIHGTPVEQTVSAETDPKAFLFYQRVKNGGTLYRGDTLVGKTARWYASKSSPPLRRKNPSEKWDTIPNGHHASLAMDITGWTCGSMTGLDVTYYENAAKKLAASCGWLECMV